MASESASQNAQGKEAERDTEATEQRKTYPGGLSLAVLCLGLCLSVICTSLDRSIIATAIPKITTEFNSLPDIGWYGSSYLLTTCCFQLLFGKVYAAGYPTKWIYLAAMGIFEVGSIICATASSSAALIIGRAVAGFGVAGIMSGAFLIISLSVPLHNRPKLTGLIGGCSGIAQIFAPFLGGVFADKVTWRWCFWINLPLGGTTFGIVLFFLRLPAHPNNGRPRSFLQSLQTFDLIGTLILFPAVVCLLLALQWGGAQYSWGNWRVILLLCIFGIATPIWAIYEWQLGDAATIPPRIIRMRSISAAIWLQFCFSGVIFGINLYVPTWFQAVKGASAYQSGINFLAATAALSPVAILSGFLTSKIGYYVPQMYACSILCSVASGLIYRFSVSTDTAYWAASLVLFGIGVGLGMQQALMVPQTVLVGGDISLGTSLIIFSQTISGAIFLSMGSNVLNNRLVAELKHIVPQVNPQAVTSAGAADLAAAMRETYPEYVSGIIQAYARALQSVFLISLVLAVLSIFGAIFMEWRGVKTKNSQRSPGEQKGEVKV